MSPADRLFCAELDKRGVEWSLTAEGYYKVETGQETLTVSLENVRRNYERDGDEGAIIRFVDQLSTDFFTEAPSWDEVQPHLRYSLEPNDYETGFDDVLLNDLTGDLLQVYVYVSPDGSRMTWVNQSQLTEWDATREEVMQRAEANMTEIIAATECTVEDIQGHKLGMLATEEMPFKASLILSPAFRELVSPDMGWPVFVVVPCRDFIYVVAGDDPDFLGRLGGVVIREYHSSGHPITKDVLLISDEGIQAIGTFPEEE